MIPISEVGNAKVVANFNQLIQSCTSHGAAYAPSFEEIKLPHLNALLLSAEAALTAINIAKPANDQAITARELAFAALNPLITRAINTLAASGVPNKTVQQARTIVRKLTGKRADNTISINTVPLSEQETNTDEIETTEKKRISVSQMSYDSRIANFARLIEFLAAIPAYNPTEQTLSIAGLRNFYLSLENKNQAVLNTAIPLSNARIQRNKILYQELTGVVAIAIFVKKYIKGLFGANSQEYKQIAKLRFSPKKIG